MNKIKVLDHGYVEFIEAWGKGKEPLESQEFEDCTDWERGIIEAARQSTQGSFRGWERDMKLLAFLYNNDHATPFEFAGITIEVQAPIFVFREWQRHRTQSYNEMSARYEPLPDLYYVPTLERLMMDGGKNKQAQGVASMNNEGVERFLESLKWNYDACERLYRRALIEGIPKELARCVMPVGHYSRMRASANLRNWLAFLTLRMAPNAQWEIRQFANVVGEIISQQFHRTWSLFNKDPTT